MKSVQQDTLCNEIANLQSRSSRLPLVCQLRLTLKTNVGEEYINAQISYQAQFSYLLSQKLWLTVLIVWDIISIVILTVP